MTQSRLRTYEIPYFPDISLPKYVNLLGEQALPVAASRLVGWVKLLASSSESFSFTLRYRYDPLPIGGQKNRRLRLQILLRKEAVDDGSGELGESMVRTVLRLDSVDPSDVSLTEDHLRCIAVLGRGENFVEESGLVHYRPERWLRSSRSRQALEPFLDEAFDTFNEPAFLDVRLRAADVRPLQSALRAAMTDLEGMKDRSYYAETLRDTYKAFLEELLPSPVCEIVICAGAATPETAQRLLQVFAIETTGGTGFEIHHVKNTSAARTNLIGGDDNNYYQPFLTPESWYSSELQKFCASKGGRHRERFKVLSQLRVVAGPELVEDFLTLPVPRQGFLRTFPLETELHGLSRSDPSPPTSAPDAIVLGQDLERSAPAQIATKQLNKHAFIAGVTGSGKTVTMFNILRQLGEQQVPIFVFEPAKAEYRGLARLNEYYYENLRVYTPGREYLNPIRLNPFEFGRGISLGEHVANLMSAFQGALPLWEPMPSILEEAVWRLYEERGWSESDDGGAGHLFPQMNNALAAINQVLDEYSYDQENDSRFRGAFRSRFVRLTRGSIGRFFDSPRTIPAAQELFKHPSVLELHALSQEQINLATMFILVLLREYLKGDEQRRDVKLVMVLEEAHNLVPSGAEGKAKGQGEVDLQAEATRYVTNMLAEMRALGLSIIVVDQTPSAVSPYVLKNTNLKLAHRTVAKEDRETLARGMLMNHAQEELLGRLLPGESFLYSEQFYRPVLIANSFSNSRPLNGTDDLGFAPSDSVIKTWLDGRQWYLESIGSRITELSGNVDRIHREASEWERTVEETLRNVADEAPGAPELDDAKNEFAKEIAGSIEDLFNTIRRYLAELPHIEKISQRIGEGVFTSGDNKGRQEICRDWESRLAEVRSGLNKLSELGGRLQLLYDQSYRQ